MDYMTAEKGTAVRLFASEAEELSDNCKEAIAQLGRCSKCNAPLAASTLGCSSDASHTVVGGFLILEKDWENFEEILGSEKRRKKDKHRAQRRADAMRDVPGFHTKDDVAAIWEAQQGQCYYCGKPVARESAKKDHMKSVADGGAEWPSNIALTCFDCNHTKSHSGATAFWNYLRKKHGAAWVTKRTNACKPVINLKKTLTARRKEELKQLCAEVERKLQKSVDEMRKSGALLRADNVYITVQSSDRGINVEHDNTVLLFPPSSHRRVKRWAATDWPQILNALLKLEAVMGGAVRATTAAT